MAASLRIAFVVHGRFHMFDLAREVLKCGHDVHLYTNYPKYLVSRFGIPLDRVASMFGHGMATHALGRAFPGGMEGWVERVGNTAFGKWAALTVPRREWDVVAVMSGVARDLFRRLNGRPTLKVLHRGSSHVRTQRALLDAEAARAGVSYVDKPSDWIIAREEEEYELADLIHVLSGFARDSFRGVGVDSDKVAVMPIGTDVAQFRASPEILAARFDRLRAGVGPLRVLSVGTFCLRKGAAVWAEALTAPGPRPYEVRFIGKVSSDAAFLARRLIRSRLAEFRPKVPQHALPAEYGWGDVFALPTVEDGFAAVLAQAHAAGLPLVVTSNCGGPDLVRNGTTGWVVPVGDSTALHARLVALAADRPALAAVIEAARDGGTGPDWANTAAAFLANVTRRLGRAGPGGGRIP